MPPLRHRTCRPAAGLALAVLAVLCGPPSAASGMALAPNDPAPRLGGLDLEGNHVAVDWGAAKLTLVNFWATGSGACATQLPRLQELHRQHEPRGLAVVGIAMDPPAARELVAAYVAHTGVTYRVLTDGERIVRLWGGVGRIPTSFLVDSRGVVLRRFVGGSEAAFEALIADAEGYLDDRPLGPPWYPEAEPVDPLERQR